MDADTTEAPGTPEKDFASSLPGPHFPMKTSSVVDSPLLSIPDESIASIPDLEDSTMPITLDDEPLRTGQDIAPYEAIICEKLTEEVRIASTSKSGRLEEALRRIASTIRYNAKWFAEDGLTALLDTALTTASSSSSSYNLSAAVNFVDTVITYSLLPPRCLELTVRFLSQTYYGATRAHKTKRLAEAAWTTLQRILESHLSDQAITALLDIIRLTDEADAESRSGYAQVVGALMIISEKMLLKHDTYIPVPLPGLVPLLDSLWSTVINGNDNIREVVMELLPIVLIDERIAMDLDAQLAWEALLDVVEPCVTLTPDSPAVKPLLDTLLLRVDRFEPRKLPVLAHLAIDSDLPLTEDLSDSLVASADDILIIRDTPNSFFRLLEKLCRSELYLPELSMLLDKAVIEVFLQLPERKTFLHFVQLLQDLAINQASTAEAADIVASAIVTMFRRSARFAGRDWEKTKLFQALCKISTRCVPAAAALFSIRADVTGAVYVESGLLSQAFPAHSSATSVTAVMHDASSLSLPDWHDIILGVLQGQAGWKIYNYFLTEIPFLLGNHSMFTDNIEFVRSVKSTVCQQLDSGLYQEPSMSTGLTKSHVAMTLVQILTVALSYHRKLSKQEILQILATFVKIAGSRDSIVSTPCIHALTICCYEIPDLMASYMDDVIDKMSKMVTQKHLAVHVLYFLAGLSLHPDLFRNFQTHDYKKIFGVCGSYLQSIRGTVFASEKHLTVSSDQSSLTSADSAEALPEHVYALAHHVIAFWYLAIKSHDRRGLREFITSCLRYKAADGRQVIEDQGLVTIDLMDRVDSKDINTATDASFDELDGRLTTTNRLSGLLLITTETSLRTSKSIVTVRRATGTDKWTIPASSCRTGDGSSSVCLTIESNEEDYIFVFPEDEDGRTCGRIYIPPTDALLGSETVLTLPTDDNVTRAIQAFDRTSALDSHKAGVIYIGEAQTTEDEILQNQMGTPEYVEFALGLGDLVELKGATFNAQGLDRENDADGPHAIIWHGQVTELVFHITTLMPNSEDVALNTASKKRHIGNDYVNIVFNNSGTPFDFNTFPSQFNLVYIVIAPSARTSFIQSRTEGTRKESKDCFYSVQVLARSGYPAISSATEPKIISGASLPGYVRNLALNECIFSLMWAYKDEPGEYPSSWRSRLLQIRRFRERYSV